MEESKIVENSFYDMIENIGLGHISRESIQIIEMKKAFYAGVLYGIMQCKECDDVTLVIKQECIDFLKITL